MALTSYLQRTQQLLTDLKQELVNPAFLVSFINTARQQIAVEGECVRALGTISTASGTQSYSFSSISVAAGLQGVMNCRMVSVASGSGRVIVTHRPWEWFNSYYYSLASPASGTPEIWSQYAQGTLGSLFLYPVPNATVTLTIDTVAVPSVLATDSDAELIPYPWTDAIPYFAAYLAYLSLQQHQKAVTMYGMYEMFARRARQVSTPTTLTGEYPGGLGAVQTSSLVPTTGSGPAGGAGGQ